MWGLGLPRLPRPDPVSEAETAAPGLFLEAAQLLGTLAPAFKAFPVTLKLVVSPTRAASSCSNPGCLPIQPTKISLLLPSPSTAVATGVRFHAMEEEDAAGQWKGFSPKTQGAPLFQGWYVYG